MSKLNRFRFFLVAASFSVLMLSVVLLHATDGAKVGQETYPQRLLTFKTSAPTGLNVATSMKFRPNQADKLKVGVEAENKTICIEFRIKSDMNAVPPHHFIETRFTEQVAKAEPELLRQPKLRTTEGTPAELQLNDFHLEVLIQPVK